MKLLKCVIAGLAAGAIGAGLWAAIAIGTNREIGWIAWGVGGLVGLAVRMASRDDQDGTIPGLIAVVIAVAAIMVGKFATVHYLVEKEIGQVPFSPISDDMMIVPIADELVGEYQQKKKPLQWPQGYSEENAEESEHYPKDLWQEAKTRYEAIPAAEREKQKADFDQQRQALVGQLKSSIRMEGFKRSFGAFDIVFFLLAVATAYRIGSGNMSSN